MGVPHKQKPINHINDIDSSTLEGRLLIIAIGRLEVLEGIGEKQLIEELNETNDFTELFL